MSFTGSIGLAHTDVESSVVVIGDIEIRRDSPVASVLLAYVNEQVHVLKEQELQVRQGASDSVHQMRVAIRRLRSVLATYRVLLDGDLVNHLREELKWLGLILGAERDAEVMSQRISEIISSEPNRVDFESAIHPLAVQLGEDLDAAHKIVLGTLDDDRYLRLLNDLDALLAGPHFTGVANESTKKIVPELIKQDWNRLKKAVRDLKENPTDRESVLHEVRKSAKRLRYAAETAELVHYKRACKLAHAAEEIQTILGDYHDSVVARDLLRRLSEQDMPRSVSDFDFEHLAALEERKADRSEKDFRRAWKRIPSGSLGK